MKRNADNENQIDVSSITDAQSSDMLRTELGKRLISNKGFVRMLNDAGIAESEPGFSRKLSKGTFTMTWYRKCMAVLGVRETDLNNGV